MIRTTKQPLQASIEQGVNRDKSNLERSLHDANDKNKITMNKPHMAQSIQALATEADSENIQNVQLNSSLPPSPAPLRPPMTTTRRSKITNEQIANLISYIVNDRMRVRAASKKANMVYSTAQRYYQQYQSDPEHKIPVAKTGLNNTQPKLTQKKIEDLIRYIVTDGMNVTQAAKNAKIDRRTAVKYYAKYLEDPERKVPPLDISALHFSKRFTQDQIKELIDYIVKDNMTVVAASKKMKMGVDTAKKYYLKYLDDPNHNIPVPEPVKVGISRCYTNEQIETLIRCIVNDGMSVLEASIKVDMSANTAGKYYRQYLDDPNHRIPTPETDYAGHYNHRYTAEQFKQFFSYIIIDKLNVPQAARKANISEDSGKSYYKRYLKYPNTHVDNVDSSYSPEKMKKMLSYIQNEQMPLKAAAAKANLNYSSIRKHYYRYLKDPQHRIETARERNYTQEDIGRFISLIENDKLCLESAAKALNMSNMTAYKYYSTYRNDPEHRIPQPEPVVPIATYKAFDKYSKIVANIYKENPSIKPIHEGFHTDWEVPDVNIRQESFVNKIIQFK